MVIRSDRIGLTILPYDIITTITDEYCRRFHVTFSSLIIRLANVLCSDYGIKFEKSRKKQVKIRIKLTA